MEPTNLDDPFTLILTVPKSLVGGEGASNAVDPVLSAKFGWTHYDVLEPRENRELYDDAKRMFERQAGKVDVVDRDAALWHVQNPALADAAENDLFVRVVRVFTQGFPVGVYSSVIGQA